jgi:hypothetical protein
MSHIVVSGSPRRSYGQFVRVRAGDWSSGRAHTFVQVSICIDTLCFLLLGKGKRTKEEVRREVRLGKKRQKAKAFTYWGVRIYQCTMVSDTDLLTLTFQPSLHHDPYPHLHFSLALALFLFLSSDSHSHPYSHSHTNHPPNVQEHGKSVLDRCYSQAKKPQGRPVPLTGTDWR